jgi:transposase
MGLSGELSPQIVEPFVHQFDDVEAIKGHNSVRGVSARKGHRCVTVVLDAESHDLLLMVEGRRAQAVTEFLAAMPARGAKAEAITEVVMDMSPATSPECKPTFPTPESFSISSIS